MYEQKQRLSNEDLIQQMIPISCEESHQNDENQIIYSTLGNRIQNIFKENAQNGAEATAKALQPIFSLSKDAADHWDSIAVITGFNSGLVLGFTADVLAKLELPTEDMKQNVLPKSLGFIIADKYFLWQKTDTHLQISFSSDAMPFWHISNTIIALRDLKGVEELIKGVGTRAF